MFFEKTGLADFYFGFPSRALRDSTFQVDRTVRRKERDRAAETIRVSPIMNWIVFFILALKLTDHWLVVSANMP